MIDKGSKGSLKTILAEAIEKAKRLGALSDDYNGKMILNCNNGGLASIEKTEFIR